MHEITVRVSVTPGRVRVFLALLFCVLFPRLCATQDTSIMTSYFPLPTGTHPNTTVTASADLARDSGIVTIGEATNSKNTALIRTNSVQSQAYYEGHPTDNVRLVVGGDMQVNGCIWLKNGAFTAPSAFNNSYYRCRYP